MCIHTKLYSGTHNKLRFRIIEVGRDDLPSSGLLVYGSPFPLACVFSLGACAWAQDSNENKDQFLVLGDPTAVKMEE